MSEKIKIGGFKATKPFSPPPRQLKVMDGKLVTIDGKDVTLDWPDGTEVNIVPREDWQKVKDTADLMRFWGA